MNQRLRKKIWICSDVWMDILPSFDHAQLGLKMALLSDRFDILVDAHFDGRSELIIWREIIFEGIGPKAKLSVEIDDKFVPFPFPDRPLPNKIRFKHLHIEYIDYSVIEFVRSNKQIWERSGTNLELCIDSIQTEDNQRIWDVFIHEIWPIFVSNIRQLYFPFAAHLDNLRRHTSPTILTDLDQLISIDTDDLFPDAIGDHFDGPNATSAGQALSKWVHTPSKNGQPKRLFCEDMDEEGNIDWVNSFKEAFARATASVSYEIVFAVHKTSIEPFEAVNERTKEKLTLEKMPRYGGADEDGGGVEFINCWLFKRCPISEKAAPIQWENDEFWDDNLNKVTINLCGDINESIGPLSPPAEEEKEKADESNEK